MDRTKFFEDETVNGIDELDMLHNNLSKFTMNYEPSYYRVDAVDLMRPDLISFKCYGTVSYWWLIMLANGLYDAFHDLQVGLLLTIPNVIDVYTFFKEYRMRS